MLQIMSYFYVNISGVNISAKGNDMTVAEMIKQTRTSENMTQEEYGMKFGVTRQTVSSWENERSMPDLQMLIDICNTYHISLDKLLNEDKEFVDKIDFYGKIRKFMKTGVICAVIVLVLFTATVVRWKIIAGNKNEAFANSAAQMGFIFRDKLYQLEENGVCYSLPNQKLPFLKEDFRLKNSYADFKIEDTEIEMTIYEDRTFQVIFNHYREISGNIDQKGRVTDVENHLNKKETELLEENRDEIEEVLKKLLEIHNEVYS